MGWTNNETTEIVAPTGTPFLPGFDVIGMGTELPPELASYAPFGTTTIQAAIVFYNSAFDATSTTPSVKFHFIAPASSPAGGGLDSIGSLCIGMGICNNPSLSTIAVCNGGLLIGAQNATAGHMSTLYEFSSHADNDIVEIGEYNAAGAGAILTFDSSGQTGALPSGA